MTPGSRRECTGVILAGGSASRMGGTAKGLLTVRGSRIADRVVSALGQATDRVVIALQQRADPNPLPGIEAVFDQRPGLGPLGGIHAALTASGTDVLAVAWDMPLIPFRVLNELRAVGELQEPDVVAPKSNSPWGFEPLCAWYNASALKPISVGFGTGEFRAGALKDRAEVLVVDVSSMGDPAELFLSVNTPEDLARAEAIAARHPQ
jgi:molybdopterin-guanine dinucleotide biosynthesis protein A